MKIEAFVRGAIQKIKKVEDFANEILLDKFKDLMREAERDAKIKITIGELRAFQTGHARASIYGTARKTSEGIEGILGAGGSGASYFKFVELGTGKYAGDYARLKPGVVGRPPSKGGMKARPVLNVTMKEMQPKVLKEIKHSIQIIAKG